MPPNPEGKLNTTDPDARRMKFGRNITPAYNVRAVTTPEPLIVAAEVTTKSSDFGYLALAQLRFDQPEDEQSDANDRDQGVDALVFVRTGLWRRQPSPLG